MAPSITSLKAREILDSRGIPTIEVLISANTGQTAIASVPSGTSTGDHEAKELRDGDSSRYDGLGVLKAVNIVNTVFAKAVIGKDPTRQTEIDQLLVDLDGTADKSRFGGNSTLSVSQAVCELGAAVTGYPIYRYIDLKYRQPQQQLMMPTPMFNVLNGGKHGDNNLDFQEFHVIPATNKQYHEALQCGEEIYQVLGRVLEKVGAVRSVGVEGGYAPNLVTNSNAFDLLLQSIHQTNYQFARDVFLGLDIAASNLYSGSSYSIRDRPSPFSPLEFIDYISNLNDKFHLFSIEDPLDQDDFESWSTLTDRLGKEVVIIGDDLLTTNKNRVKEAIEKRSCSGILVKPNQIGTISETIEVIKMAKQANWSIVVSHRSGETDDDFIADFAVGVKADYVKFGAPARGERVAKYNRLLSIEQEISSDVSTI